MGGAVEEVTVKAETPLLETTNASLGNVVDARRVAELPTPHGDPYALIGLAAGVSYTGSTRLDRPFEPTHIVGYAMDGTRGNRSDLTIDGIPSTATANANEVIASYVPPPDIVQEFKVQTATFDASFGNTEGGVTNLSIKSGTNSLQGTAYFVKTPPSLFSNDFFANANNIPLADFTYNRYGGMAGGPVMLPGYDGRRKTFFMYGFEGIHEARPRNNGTPTVPTEKMRNGDFSELLALGPQYQIYNPFTRRAIGGGRFQSDPFPGNIIPANLMNPVAKAALGYIGKPLTAGNTDGTSNFQQPVVARDDQVRDEHDPHRPDSDQPAAPLWPRQLVRSQQQLQQLLQQPLDRRVVPVHLAAVRSRPCVGAQLDHGDEPALRIQPLRARDRHESGQPRVRPHVTGVPRGLQLADRG